MGRIAQLDRASAFEAEGCRFKSCRGRQPAKRQDTAAEIGLAARSSPGLTPVRNARCCGFPLHDGARLACGPSVGEIAGLAESSTYVGKSARIVASIRTEKGPLSFLAQP